MSIYRERGNLDSRYLIRCVQSGDRLSVKPRSRQTRMAKEISEMSELGRIIRYQRKRAGLSRAALSDLAGVGTTVIYELEHGKRTVQFDVLQSILRTLNLRILLDGPLLEEYPRKIDETS